MLISIALDKSLKGENNMIKHLKNSSGELELHDWDLLQQVRQDPRQQGLQDRHGAQQGEFSRYSGLISLCPYIFRSKTSFPKFESG